MKPLLLLLLLPLITFGAPSAKLVALLRQVPDKDHYSPREMVLATNAFLALGPEGCEAALEELCRWSVSLEGNDWYQTNGRLLLLMRLLYVSDSVDPVPVPAMGAPEFPVTEENWREWPYFPFEISNGVPLFLPSGYLLAGTPVLAGKYLGFCREKGWLRRAPFPVPTEEALRQAIRILVSSRRWRASTWRVFEVGDAAHSTVSEEIGLLDHLYEQCGIAPMGDATNRRSVGTVESSTSK